MPIKLPEGAGAGKVTDSFDEEDDTESRRTDIRVDEATEGLETTEDLGVEYPNVPEITQMGSDFPGFIRTLLPNTMAAMTSDDLGKAEVFENAFKDDDRWGGKGKDKFGHPMIRWNNKLYYINKPGFTGTDFNTVLGEMLKYLPASKYASGAKSVLTTIGRGTVAYSATETSSKAGEAFITPETVRNRGAGIGDIASDVGLMTGIGVGADVVLPPAVKFGAKVLGPVVKPVVDKAVEGTARTIAALDKNIKNLSDSVTRRLPNATPDDVLVNSKYPLTQGQRAANPPEGVTPQQTEQLGQEDVLRQTASSDLGTITIRGFDDIQLGEIRSDALKLQEEFGAGTVGADGIYSNIPLAAGEQIQTIVGKEVDRLKTESSELYEAVKAAPEQPMMSASGVNTVAKDVLAEYKKVFSAGQLDGGPLFKEVINLKKLIKLSENPKYKDQSLTNIHGYQKRLNTAIGSAPVGSPERIALQDMKRVLDESVFTGIEKGLISGDKEVLDQLQNATGLYKDYMGLVGRASAKDLREKAANRILEQITNKNYTPRDVVNLMFGHNKFAPNQSMPLVISKLRNILPEAQFVEVKALLKDGILTKAFGGKGGEITRSAIVKNYNDIFNNQKAIINELFTPDEILKIKQFRQNVLPTLWAEIKLNPSGTGYTMIGALARQQLLTFPTPLIRAASSTFLKGVDEAKSANFAIDAVRQTLNRFQTPLISATVSATIRPEVRDETSLDNSRLKDLSNLQGSIDNFQMPQAQGSMFDAPPPSMAPPPTLAPQQMVSPTLLPNEDDREIAMRQQAGIAGLV